MKEKFKLKGLELKDRSFELIPKAIFILVIMGVLVSSGSYINSILKLKITSETIYIYLKQIVGFIKHAIPIILPIVGSVGIKRCMEPYPYLQCVSADGKECCEILFENLRKEIENNGFIVEKSFINLVRLNARLFVWVSTFLCFLSAMEISKLLMSLEKPTSTGSLNDVFVFVFFFLVYSFIIWVLLVLVFGCKPPYSYYKLDLKEINHDKMGNSKTN